MKLYQLTEEIERYCPPELAYDWDNSGLLLGDKNQEIKTVCVCLDIKPETVKQAAACGADVIVSHHPLLFKPIKRIVGGHQPDDMLLTLIEHHISVYCAHTNMDTSPHGINAKLAEMFSLHDVRIIDVHTDDKNAGLGRIGTLPAPMKASVFASMVRDKLRTPFVRTCGDAQKMIYRAAFLSGSCSEYVEKAVINGADAVITGDLKYHECLDFVNLGTYIIDAGHFPTEHFVVNIFADILKNFSDLNIKILSEEDIFTII